ncbi:MAG: hypothetical protein WC044_08540 [Crocinitomicaceae bacterium]
MKRIPIYLILTLLLLNSFHPFAQDSDQSGRNSVIKFTPSKLMRGEILFSYERKIAEQASLELSFGPAISNVFPINLDHLLGNGSNAQETSLLGFTTSLGARYYPLEDKDAMEGFYISPVFGFTQLNYLFSAQNYGFQGGAQIADIRGKSNQSSFAFVFGIQKWLTRSFSLDMYIGSGLKQVNENNYYLNYLNDPYTGQMISAVWVDNPITDVRWFLTGGVKIGLGFGKKR